MPEEPQRDATTAHHAARAAVDLVGHAVRLPDHRRLRAFLRTVDVSLTSIGVLSLVTLPWNFKFLWAPLIDRYAFQWPDRRRSWILISQIALAVGLHRHRRRSVLVGHARRRRLDTRSSGCSAASRSSSRSRAATQDIAVDAFAVEYLRPEEQAPASGHAHDVLARRLSALQRRGDRARRPRCCGRGFGRTIGTNDAWPWVFVGIAVLFLPLLAITLVPAGREAGRCRPASLRQRGGGAARQLLQAAPVVCGALPRLLQVRRQPRLEHVDPLHGRPRHHPGRDRRAQQDAGDGRPCIAGATLGGLAGTPKLGLGRALWIFGVVQGSRAAFYALAR